jgi:energy-coupling factor transporter ATP-binding protein EcfA2
MNEEKITYFGQTDARNKKVNFGIKAKDRTKHVYVIGKTGMGKSTLLENMAVQDIKNGEGMAFLDPHGKTAELLLEYIPENRRQDVVYFAPFDMDYPISFNVLENVDHDKRHLVVSGLMSTFKKIWQDAWSARMEYILTNTLLALLEYPDATLLGVNRMLSDKEFRKQVVACVTDPSVKSFWVQEFANYTERMAAEAVPAIQNKIGQFTANALIRNMIGQPKSSFNIREMMDKSKIFIVNLSKGRIGESNANLLGGMIITKIYLAALSRADVSDNVIKKLPNFYLFVDEFQSFANESFADILSEARKYKLNLTMAHQYIEQMEEEVRAAVFGNVGTMIVFRVGAYDAEVLEKEFAPQFTAEDIVNLGIFQIYLKLMIDGISSSPFSATTLPPIPLPEKSNATAVIEESRRQFASKRVDVEKKIELWLAPIKPIITHKNPLPAGTLTPAPNPTLASTPKPTVQVATQPINQNLQDNAKIVDNHPNPIVHKEEIKKEKFEEKIVNHIKPHPTLPKLKSVSLNSLTNTPKVHNHHKDAHPQRINELKSALASVLAHKDEHIKKDSNSINQTNTSNSHKPNEVHKSHTNHQEKSDTKREVPEDVLRDVLKVK